MSTGSNEHTFFSGCPPCKCIFSSRNQSHPPFKCHLYVDSPLTTPHFSSSNLVIPLHCRAEATVSNQGTCVTGCAGKHSLQGQRVSRSTSHVRPLSGNWRSLVPARRLPHWAFAPAWQQEGCPKCPASRCRAARSRRARSLLRAAVHPATSCCLCLWRSSQK